MTQFESCLICIAFYCTDHAQAKRESTDMCLFPFHSSYWSKSLQYSFVTNISSLELCQLPTEPNSVTLKMEAACFSKKTEQTYYTTWCKNPEHHS